MKKSENENNPSYLHHYLEAFRCNAAEMESALYALELLIEKIPTEIIKTDEYIRQIADIRNKIGKCSTIIDKSISYPKT